MFVPNLTARNTHKDTIKKNKKNVHEYKFVPTYIIIEYTVLEFTWPGQSYPMAMGDRVDVP